MIVYKNTKLNLINQLKLQTQMDSSQFKKPRKGSSSSSSKSSEDDGDDGTFGDDEPQRTIVKTDDGLTKVADKNERFVVIVHPTNQTCNELIDNQTQSQSQKNSAMRPKSRPQIYDEVLNNNYTDGRQERFQNQRKNQYPRHYNGGNRQNLRNDRNQQGREGYSRANLPYYYNRQDNGRSFRDRHNNYNHQYNNREESTNEYNIHHQTNHFNQGYQGHNNQGHNQHNEPQNYQQNDHRDYQNTNPSKPQRQNNFHENGRNQEQQRQTQNSNRDGGNQKRTQYQNNYPQNNRYNNAQYERQHQLQQSRNFNYQDRQSINKKQQHNSIYNNIQRQHDIYRRNQPFHERRNNNQGFDDQENQKIQIQQPSLPQKSQQRLISNDRKSHQQNKKVLQKQNFTQQKNKPMAGSSHYHGRKSEIKAQQRAHQPSQHQSISNSLNQAHTRIDMQNSKYNANNQKSLEESSLWQQSDQENKSQEEAEMDKSSFQCQQISLYYPMSPPIHDHNHYNQSLISEDMSLLNALNVNNIPILQIDPIPHIQQQLHHAQQSSLKSESASILSNDQLLVLQKMFECIPAQGQTVFVQMRVRTQNISLYKIKKMTSELYLVKNSSPQIFKGHKFISIKQSQKKVPRDSQPFSRNNHQVNEKIELKTTKLILAQIKNPLQLLAHKEELLEKFSSNQETKLISKIESNKKLIKQVSFIINIEEVTLKCSSCNNKKSFMWNDQNIAHQCSILCPNFLRFNIESVSLC